MYQPHIPWFKIISFKLNAGLQFMGGARVPPNSRVNHSWNVEGTESCGYYPDDPYNYASIYLMACTRSYMYVLL